MKQQQKSMNRLPGFDGTTSRAEGAVFAGMGVSALALIFAAVAGSLNYSNQREAIVESLTEPHTVIVQKAPAHKSLTNIAARTPDARGSNRS